VAGGQPRSESRVWTSRSAPSAGPGVRSRRCMTWQRCCWTWRWPWLWVGHLLGPGCAARRTGGLRDGGLGPDGLRDGGLEPDGLAHDPPPCARAPWPESRLLRGVNDGW